MSAGQFDALHSALGEGLASVKAAGQFQAIALADGRGLAWASDGNVPAPDHLAAIPSLVARAFADRQPLLRFFSDKSMRFEYRSDTLAYIKKGLEGSPAEAAYFLDVPGDKDAAAPVEFVVGWGQSSLVLRPIQVGDDLWCLLGITKNASLGRNALAKAAPGLAALLAGVADVRPSANPLPDGESIRMRLLAALETFRSCAPDILMAAVTSKDGFVVAALPDSPVDAEVVAPLVGHSFLAIQESTQQLCGATESAMLRMEEGILLARELTGGLLFASLLAPTACTGLVMSAFETAASALRGALESLPAAVAAPRAEEVAV